MGVTSCSWKRRSVATTKTPATTSEGAGAVRRTVAIISRTARDVRRSRRGSVPYATNNAACRHLPRRLGAVEAHIHVTAGAIPKDGRRGHRDRNALVPRCGTPVRKRSRDTGESRARRVLRSGAQEKGWGHSEGSRTIIIPKQNEATSRTSEEVRRTELPPVETCRVLAMRGAEARRLSEQWRRRRWAQGRGTNCWFCSHKAPPVYPAALFVVQLRS